MSTRRSGLFRRIYATFVVTLLLAAGVVGGGVFLSARTSDAWVTHAIERFDDDSETLIADLGDADSLRRHLEQIDAALQTRSAIYTIGGDRVVGHGPEVLPKRRRRLARRRAQLEIHRVGALGREVITLPLLDSEGEVRALVHVAEAPADRRPWIALGAAVTLVGLALGARRLAKSLTRRISRLEESVGRIARGELAHRVTTPADPIDEVDELGIAVNEMAVRLERLVASQRVLLANVSHELRTPLARIKVLLELLDERLQGIRPTEAARPTELEPLRKWLNELGQDVAEIEALIHDLLTTGRLELRAGEALACEQIALSPLLHRLAARYDARCEAEGALQLWGDQLLLERLFSNLLTNARRADPGGDVSITATRDGDTLRIWVEDHGSGIAPHHRDLVFEPFRRLDDARSRDRGGAGLGLYLCQQICRAHGGSILATDRRDGAPGACLAVTLPVAHAPAAAPKVAPT